MALTRKRLTGTTPPIPTVATHILNYYANVNFNGPAIGYAWLIELCTVVMGESAVGESVSMAGFANSVNRQTILSSNWNNTTGIVGVSGNTNGIARAMLVLQPNANPQPTPNQPVVSDGNAYPELGSLEDFATGGTLVIPQPALVVAPEAFALRVAWPYNESQASVSIFANYLIQYLEGLEAEVRAYSP